MEHRAPPPPSRRPPRAVLAGLAIVVLVVAGFLARPSLSDPDAEGVVAEGLAAWTSGSSSPSLDVRPSHAARTVVGPDDGVIPHGAAVSVFDDDVPAVARLDPELLAALRQAAVEAEADGVGLRVNSGWRSPEHQQRLLEDAIAEHGSQEEAARWVATPETSLHVSGDAVDIGPAEAAAWLTEHGGTHGLCQVYDNEPWHFELRAEAVDHGCPPRYADPTADPRMQP